jgi:phosphoglycerol transferase MdoB-like AlkP superfamily enzyme
MDPYMQGMGLFFWATIILYFLSRKRGGKWKTAFIIVAWIFSLGFWYYLIVKSAGFISLYTISLAVLAVVCFVKRSKSEVLKTGFWLSLVYVVPTIVGLILAIAD